MQPEYMQQMRSFLMDANYDSAEELVACAAAGGPAQDLVDFGLQLRNNIKTRHKNTLEKLAEDWPDRDNKKWIQLLLPSIWSMYRVFKVLCNPENARDTLPLESPLKEVSKEVRHALRGTGVVTARAPSVALRIAQADETLGGGMVPGDIGMWVDNFDVCRF